MADIQPASSYSSDSTNYFTGYMVKQGGRIKTWKRRFFVLEKRNRMLRYYKHEEDTLPKGVIHIVGYSVSDADEELKRSFSFKISKEGFRTYFMIADDASSKASWMQILAECSAEDGAPSPVLHTNSVTNFDNDTDLSDEEDGDKSRRKHSAAPKLSDNTLLPIIKSSLPEHTLVNIGFGSHEKGYGDPNATLIQDYERPDPNATLLGADMLALRAVDDPNVTLIGVGQDDNATLFTDSQASPNRARQQVVTVPHIRLFSHNEYFSSVDRDVLRTLKFGRAKPDEANHDPDFIGFDSKVVSRRHAEIWAVHGEFYIRDTKSQSGTFLNAMRLSLPGDESKPFKLKNGDIIQLGVDFRGSVENNTKCVSMTCELSFRKTKEDGLPVTPAPGVQIQLSDLTSIGRKI